MKDAIIQKLITQETKRQRESINLIASENIVSNDVLEALGSPLTNKYAEGYPGARYYGGNQYIDQIELLAQKRALELFNLDTAWMVNVQPYSGSPANLAVYSALVPPGGKIMGLELSMGGHLTHGHKASMTSKIWQSVPYQLDQSSELLDYKAIETIAIKEKPALIIAGYTAYSRIIDFKKFRKIADSVGAYLMVDMSHFAGLVAGEVYPSPFPYADVVTTTTHKTLRGPRGAMLFSNTKSKIAKKHGVDIAKAIDRAVFPGLQGGPHINQIAAMAVALKEAKTPAFKRYAAQVIKNAQALANELQQLGWRIISGGTDSHLFLVDTTARGLTGQQASEILEQNGIIVNKNSIPFDTRPPLDPSGIRLGTPALTTQGFKEKEMRIIAHLITETLLGSQNISKEIKRLISQLK